MQYNIEYAVCCYYAPITQHISELTTDVLLLQYYAMRVLYVLAKCAARPPISLETARSWTHRHALTSKAISNVQDYMYSRVLHSSIVAINSQLEQLEVCSCWCKQCANLDI